MLKIREIREKSLIELGHEITEQRRHCRDLKFKIAAKQLKNVRQLRTAKKWLAKLLTVQQEKKRAEDK